MCRWELEFRGDFGPESVGRIEIKGQRSAETSRQADRKCQWAEVTRMSLGVTCKRQSGAEVDGEGSL